MGLDDRLRKDLRDAVEPGHLRADEALDNVWMQHRRGLVRSGRTRQALAATIVLSLFALVALVVSWRNVPDHAGVAARSEHRFRSIATVRVAPAATSGSTSTTISRDFKPADPRTVALAPSTLRAALLSAHLSPDDSSIGFRAKLNPKKDLLSLTATAPSGSEATAVAREWASAFAKARRVEATRALRAAALDVNRRVAALHRRLNAVDASLRQIDPVYYAKLRYNPLFHYGQRPLDLGPTGVRANATDRERNLGNERIRVLQQLADLGAEYASTQITAVGPSVFATLVAQTPAVRVDTSRSSTVPVLVGVAIGLLGVLAAAVFVYRRRTRATRQVSA